MVAIIALLLAILLPSLGSARDLSRRAAGAANLHGIGRAYGMYASEWDNTIPLCLRAYRQTSAGAGGSTMILDNAQRVAHWSYQNLGQWLAADSFRTQNELFATSKIWNSPGTGVTNPFLQPIVYAGTPSPPGTSYFDHYRLYEFNAGRPKWLQPGQYKGGTFMSYLWFAGDPGNQIAGQQVYTWASDGTAYTGFDRGRTSRSKYSDFAPGELVMQDMAIREPTSLSGFYNANYMRKPAFITPTTAFGGSSGYQAYVQGFAVTDDEQNMAGVNALYADLSVQWVKFGDLDKIIYRTPAAPNTQTTLYVAQRK